MADKTKIQKLKEEAIRLGRQAKQGATFGFADEVQDIVGAAIASNLSKDITFKDALSGARDLSREELAKDWQESPGVSLAGQVIGGIPLGFSRAGQAATNWIRGGNALQGLLKGSAIGAGYSGAAGLGAAGDSLSERATGLGIGTGLGAILGGATAPLARFAKSDGNVDYRKVTKKAVKQFSNKAEQELAKQLAARPDLPQQTARAQAVYAAAKKTGIPLTLAEVVAQSSSDPLLAQQAVISSNPMTAGRMAQMYAARSGTPQQAGQIEQQLLKVAKGLAPDVGSYDDAAASIIGASQQGQRDITKKLVAQANPLYEEAFSQPSSIINQRIGDFVNTPEMQSGISRGLKIQKLESIADGAPFDPKAYGITGFNEAGDPIIGSAPNTRLLDAGKRGLDAMIQENTDQFGRVNDMGRALTKFKTSLLSEIDAVNPAYGAAREVYSGQPDVLAMRNQIGSLANIDPMDAKSVNRALFSGTQQNAEMAAQALGKKAPTATAARIYEAIDTLRNDPVNIASRIAPDARTTEMLRAYGSGGLDETLSVINQAKLGERMRYGSPTQPRMEAEKGLEKAANAAIDVATGGKTSLMRRVASIFGKGSEDVDPQFYSDMADLMTTEKGMDLLKRVGTGQKKAIQELNTIGLPSIVASKANPAFASMPVSRALIGGMVAPTAQTQDFSDIEMLLKAKPLDDYSDIEKILKRP
jgi:hypothetical protein